MRILVILICLFYSNVLFAQRNGTAYCHLDISGYTYKQDFKVLSLRTNEVISTGFRFSPEKNFVDSIIVQHPMGITDTFFVRLKHRRDYYSLDLKPTQALLDAKVEAEQRRQANLKRILDCPESSETEKEEEKETYEVVEEMVEYPGGMEEMKMDLANGVRYPQIALDMGISGKAYLKFVINIEGNIECARIIRGVPDCPECDQEALFGLASLKTFKPAKVDGIPVRSYYTLPIAFIAQ